MRRYAGAPCAPLRLRLCSRFTRCAEVVAPCSIILRLSQSEWRMVDCYDHFPSSILHSQLKTPERTSFRGFSLSKKYYFNFYASCGSTHLIEFAEQIHKNRGRVPRFLYFKREKVSEWELSDVRVLRSQNTDCRKNDSFSTVSSGRGTASAAFAFYSQSILSMLKITGRASSEQQVIISFSRFTQPL